MQTERLLLSGDEAVARAARDAQVALGTGYPGTPSTEILESFSDLGGKAQWSPNEKVALEVAIGVAFAGCRAIVTMKHVGLNVAADPLFTASYTGVDGALVIVSADDPGMASSQNEQDNRHYAVAAAIPMLEPSDSQEAYDSTLLAVEISERWRIPVLLRMTTRVCHSCTVVRPHLTVAPPANPSYERDAAKRVMIPAYARPAHRRLREKIDAIAQWNEAHGPNRVMNDGAARGIVTSGISYMHVREADPAAAVLKLGMTYPLPIAKMREFARPYAAIHAIEEGDPHLADAARAAGIAVAARPVPFRFGELNVDRVRRILSGDASPEAAPPAGKPPELCPGCPHRTVFNALRDLNCIVAGDIGCYTLGVLPPFNALDTCVCMGAGITVGLGLRHALPPEKARRVVSVIGDSTFLHSGISGLVEAVYNPPHTGHLTIILDNGTTAMTGLQEHPGTGRSIDHGRAGKVVIEHLVESLGIAAPTVIDHAADPAAFRELVRSELEAGGVRVIVARRNCLLATAKIKSYEQALQQEASLVRE